MHLIQDDLLVAYQKGRKVDNRLHLLMVSIPTNLNVIQTTKIENYNDDFLVLCMDTICF